MSLIQYQSPFKIIGLHPEDGKIDKRLLKLSKKQLLAEFQLHNSVTITINGAEFDKNGILKLFAELESNTHLDHHICIFNNPDLLAFLEKGDLQSYDRLVPDDLEGKPGFVNFAGLYFSNRFSDILSKAIKKKDISVLEFIFDHELPVAPKFHGECFQAAYRLIAGKIREIETLADGSRKKYIPESYLTKLIDSREIRILNTLPEYFSGLRDRYAQALRNLAIMCYNELKKIKLSKRILRRALDIDTSERVKTDIEDLLRQIESLNIAFSPDKASYNRGARWQQGKEKKTQSGWLIPMIISIVLMGLIRNCNESSPSSGVDFSFQPTTSWESDLSDVLKNLKTKYAVGDDFLDLLDSLSSNSEETTDPSGTRPATGDRPYQAYFDQNTNDALRLSSILTPKDQVAFSNEGPYDAMVFIETVFGIVDHFYLRAGDQFNLDSYKRMESQIGFHIWLGNQWDHDREILPGNAYGSFTSPAGWIKSDLYKNSVSTGFGKTAGNKYEIKVTEIKFSMPVSGFEKSVKTTLVRGLLYSGEPVGE